MEPEKQAENKPKRNAKGQLLPGSTANLKGRPVGKTLKEYQAGRFRQMSDEEKEEYLSDLAKIERWRMAEGNPHSTEESKQEVTITPVLVKFIDGKDN